MPKYDFHELLEPLEFEKLVCDVVQVREGLFVEMYREGRDLGIDGSYINHGKKTIIQVKRCKDFNQLFYKLKNSELPKVRKLKPDRYILGVSFDFQPGQKEQIIESFKKYIKNNNDILSRTDINRLLEEPNYHWVESAHPKLWLPSINVFEKLLLKSIHRSLYRESAEELKEAIKASTKFAPTQIYREALQKWSQNHVIIISGEPGVGKTTLAYLLALAYLQPEDLDGFIWGNSIEDIYNMLEDDRKQVIILDDFWGSIFHNENTSRKDESRLIKLIQRIIDYGENKRLILTTREYILRQGLQKQPMLKETLEQYAMICTMEKYNNAEKANILFQHLYASNLKHEHVTYLFHNCGQIINHANYNPRVLALYLNKEPDKETSAEECFFELCDYFDNPGAFWEDIFLELSQEAQIVALLLLISSTPMNLEDMKRCYAQYIATRSNRMGIKKLSDSISELEKTMIKSFYSDEEDEILLKFNMPSVQDFLYSYIQENTEQFIPELIQCCAFYNQLQFLLEHFSKSSSKQITEMLEEQCILHYVDYPYCYTEPNGSWNWASDRLGDLPNGEEELHRFFQVLHCCDPHLHPTLFNFLESEINNYCVTMGHGNIEAQYIDLHNLPDIIFRCIKKGMHFNGRNIINQFYQEAFSVYHYMAMEKFQEVFPDEYSIYHDNYFPKIKKELKTILLTEIELLDDLCMEIEIDMLVDDIPEILNHFGLRYTNQFGEKIASLCGRKPILVQKESIVKTDNNIYRDEEEQSLEMVKEDAENWLFGPNEIPLDDEQILEFITESDLQLSLKKELRRIFKNNHHHYIHDYLQTRESITLSLAALHDLENLPDVESSLCIIIIQHLLQQNTNSKLTNLIDFCAETFGSFMYLDEPVIRASEFLSSDIYNHYLKNDPVLCKIVFGNLVLQDSQWVRFLHIPIYTFCYAFTTCMEFRNEEDSDGESRQEFWKEVWGNNFDKLKRTIKYDKGTENSIYYAEYGIYYFKNYDWEGRMYRMYQELDPFQFNRLYVSPRIEGYLNQLNYESEESRVKNHLALCKYEFYYDDSGTPHSSTAFISDELSMFEHLKLTKNLDPYPKQLSKSKFKELKNNSDICNKHNENWSVAVYKIKDVELLKEIGAYEETLGLIQELEKVHVKFCSGDYSSIL